MNKQRKVVITTTYNELGIIIDTKAEEVAQPDLQPTCNKRATDCISRHAVSAWLDNIGHPEFANVVMDENSFPPAQLERKKGRWKQWEEYGFEDTYECTVCKTPFVLIDGTPMDNEYYFCPHCGTDMREG